MAIQSRYSVVPRNAAPVVVGDDPGKTRSFLPSLNFAGSSSRGSTPQNFQRQDYPAIQAGTGRLISGVTGLPWTGPAPGTGTTPPVNPNDPNRYQALEVIKSPEVAGGANVLMDSFKQGAETTAKGWTDFFNEAKAAQAANKTAFNREQESFNIAPLANELRANNEAFATQSRDIGSRYSGVDAEYEAAQRKLAEQAYYVLPQYDAAAQAIANRQFAVNAGRVSRYKAGSGTPTSLGSSELAMLNRAAADVYLPLEREKIARRMGLITDLSMPLEREFAGRDTVRLGDEYQREQYLSERNADTEKQIKQLEIAVAGMSRAQAESYVRSLGLPMQIQQEILARHISNLGGIAQLEDQSRYRGLQDTQGINLTPTVAYSMGTGTYPTIPPNTYRPNVPDYQPVYNPSTGTSGAPGSTPIAPPYWEDPKYPPQVQDMLRRNATVSQPALTAAYRNYPAAPANQPYNPLALAPGY
jgi:hypothetical protein